MPTRRPFTPTRKPSLCPFFTNNFELVMTTKTFFSDKSWMILVMFFCIINASFAQTKKVQDVDKAPQFPGGDSAMMTYLGSNIKYPESAKKDKVEGMVVVQFVVRKDGSITDAHNIVSDKQTKNAELNMEALRVIRNMPKWTPGEKDGKKVDCEMVLPVKFKLD